MREKSEFRNQPANCDAVKASRHRSVVRSRGISRFGLAILMLAASLLMVVAHGFSGALSMADLTALLGAAGGVGLIAAKDGGH